MKFITNLTSGRNRKENAPKQPYTASVAVDGAGIISVESKALLKSQRGQKQLAASKNITLHK